MKPPRLTLARLPPGWRRSTRGRYCRAPERGAYRHSVSGARGIPFGTYRGGVRRAWSRACRRADRGAAGRTCGCSFPSDVGRPGGGHFQACDEPVRERLLAELDLETKAAVARLLAYPENTAGSTMTTEFVSVPSTWTVQTLDHIRKVEKTRETIYAIYLLDPKTKIPVKPVSLRRLIAGAPQDPVLSVAPHRRPPYRRRPIARTSPGLSPNTTCLPFRSWISGALCSASLRSTTSSMP